LLAKCGKVESPRAGNGADRDWTGGQPPVTSNNLFKIIEKFRAQAAASLRSVQFNL
jgi:hypothetical protein